MIYFSEGKLYIYKKKIPDMCLKCLGEKKKLFGKKNGYLYSMALGPKG